jgi:hypothetical protein
MIRASLIPAACVADTLIVVAVPEARSRLTR